MPLSFALVLHAHQPVDNFASVIEQSYQSAYLPFLEAAAARPWLRLNLHFTGFLLEWLEQQHPEYIALLQRLDRDGRLEMLGGGFYEPILAAISSADQQEQLRRLASALERLFGHRPPGAWLAERVWEPDLPAALARAGVEYVLLDDSHLQLAGLAAADLHGYWLTEAQSSTVAVIPSNYFLRQALPFRPENEGLEFLSAAAARLPNGLLTMGDDLEKFGSWPHTSKHVYGDGWLQRFLDALEQRQKEITTVRLSDYLASHPARGLVYIPSASYPEMMRWAGSNTWRGFLTRYAEANLLHKTQQDLSRRLAACKGNTPAAGRARDHLLAAECNDVYWHGWFGGLYSPHLREVAFRHLLAADQALAKVAPLPATRRFDLLRNGSELVEMRSSDLRLLLAPGDGATVLELDALAAHANLINSFQRRPEAYHDDLRQRATSNPAKLPGADEAPAAALAARLVYDACAPAGARLYSGAAPDTAAYQITRLEPGNLRLAAAAAEKHFSLQGTQLCCEMTVPAGAQPLALEWNFNLLAPDAPDRGLIHAGQRYRLDWQGSLPAGPLTLCDGWRRLHLDLSAEGTSGWTVEPRYSVSRSEQGFEALYQGSGLRAHWPPGTVKISMQVKIFPCHCHF
ncbi:MAG: alpha-amylase/4-alpha-glucanotransferase domain-containing protein [Terriglobales bacterium]